MMALFNRLITTNVTKTIHRKVYPAIDPSNPALSQKGQTVLITGGGTNIGLSMSRAFVRANAATLIIIGRRANVLEEAKAKLEQEAKTAGTQTKIITSALDVTDRAAVDALWKGFADQGIHVDVYVANAAKFTEPKPVLELGVDEVWDHVEVNALSPLRFIEKLHAQPGTKQKVAHPFALPARQ